MAAQIKTCFERYEKKYRLTAERQRAILQGMAPYMKKAADPHLVGEAGV